jgi:uncharacterized protein
MRVVITGATGVIGRALVVALRARGDDVVALSRDDERARMALGDGVDVFAWPDPVAGPPPADALGGADAVVNLIGEPLAQRWTAEVRRKIRESRVLGTRSLVAGLRSLLPERRPRTLVSQSAVGYYGAHGAEPVDEQSPPADDFLARVVVEWEREATAASDFMRVLTPRTGVVLSAEGGALRSMLPFFRLGLGGPIAGGRQYIPWIHIDDVVGALLLCMDRDEAAGPVNLSAPAPVTNAEFSRALGRALSRPAILPVPGFAMRLLYGEMAAVVTTGARVLPARLEQFGYEFLHRDVEEALRAVV